jgi:hypothetical protein
MPSDSGYHARQSALLVIKAFGLRETSNDQSLRQAQSGRLREVAQRLRRLRCYATKHGREGPIRISGDRRPERRYGHARFRHGRKAKAFVESSELHEAMDSAASPARLRSGSPTRHRREIALSRAPKRERLRLRLLNRGRSTLSVALTSSRSDQSALSSPLRPCGYPPPRLPRAGARRSARYHRRRP